MAIKVIVYAVIVVLAQMKWEILAREKLFFHRYLLQSSQIRNFGQKGLQPCCGRTAKWRENIHGVHLW